MSNRNSTFNDLKTTSQNIQSLLTALWGLTQYHNAPSEIQTVVQKLEDESSDLDLSLALISNVPDFAKEVGLLRGLPLDEQHKPTQE